MPNYIQLRNQIQKLQKEAEILLRRERAETISNIKEAIAAFDLTAEDLGLAINNRNRPGRKAGEKIAEIGLRERKVDKRAAREPTVEVDKRSVVAPKYRDASTGAAWTGRGKQPKWLAAALKSGKKLEDFKI